jgi:hypothetical protein
VSAHGFTLSLIAVRSYGKGGYGIQVMDAEPDWMLHQDYFDPVEELGPAPDAVTATSSPATAASSPATARSACPPGRSR